MSHAAKITTMIMLVFMLCQADGYAANRVFYENFDDKVLDSRFGVYGHNWAPMTPPQYNLGAVGRNGKGYCFSSGSVNEANLLWKKDIYNPWPTDELYVSFWMRYPTFRSTDAHENIKFFYPRWDGIDSYVHYAMSSNNSVYYSAMSRGSMVTAGRWLTCPNQVDGKWHHYEFYIKFSTGVSKFWYDGSLKVNDTFGRGKWTNTMYYIHAPSIDAEEPGSFSRQVDDYEVWDGMPSSNSSNGTALPAPSGVSIRIMG